MLWSRLRNRQLEGYKFRRQQVIDMYITDFLCLEPKLAIELDGGQHAERREQDDQRTRYLEGLGYRVLHFWNHDVLREPEALLEVIRDALLRTTRPPHPNPLPEGEGI